MKTLREKQSEFAEMLGRLLCKATELAMPVFILELYRSLETQKVYVPRGVSKTLKSDHLDGLAVDLIFLDDIRDDGKLIIPQRGIKYWVNSGNLWLVTAQTGMRLQGVLIKCLL